MPIQKESPAANGAQRYSPNQYTNNAGSTQDIAEMFTKALSQEGLATRDKIIPDGRLHRFHIDGDKHGTQNGWYVLHAEGLIAGAFGCWKRQVTRTWFVKEQGKMNIAERREFRQRVKNAKAAKTAEEQKLRADARRRAEAIWASASSVPDNHPYLIEKGVRSHGLRLHRSALLVPMQDGNGVIHSLQFIDGEGNKRFLSGGLKKGCYFLIGSPAECLCIAEGYATAATIHEVMDYSVAVAFDAGNLLSVALALRTRYPLMNIILCADNDVNTHGNPGLTKAREAAAAIGARLAVPPIAGDFNDLYRRKA